jgi:hypothetical protein
MAIAFADPQIQHVAARDDAEERTAGVQSDAAEHASAGDFTQIGELIEHEAWACPPLFAGAPHKRGPGRPNGCGYLQRTVCSPVVTTAPAILSGSAMVPTAITVPLATNLSM